MSSRSPNNCQELPALILRSREAASRRIVQSTPETPSSVEAPLRSAPQDEGARSRCRIAARTASAGIIACGLAFLLPASAQSRELRVCADPNNLPFSNEQQEGFENKLVELIAEELGAEVSYTWWAQRRGFLRNTLQAGLCDLVPGTPALMEMLGTTEPYYRSTYVFMTRAGEPIPTSFDDPLLRHAKVGIQLIGDEGFNTPPAHALARRGIIDNVRGYTVYGDYREPNPPARIVEAVARSEIDVAVVWGPLGGYFATRERIPLEVTPVHPAFDGPELPMVFDIAMGVRSDDEALRTEIDDALKKRRTEVDAILAAYGVPRVDVSSERAQIPR
jgi:mxaJ protein